MRSWLRHLIRSALALMLFQLFIEYSVASAQPLTPVCVNVIDANSKLPVPHATILLWDLTLFRKLGVYFTDENGEYNIPRERIVLGHIYKIYAYKGDFAARVVDYAPTSKTFRPESSEPGNVSFSLIPGALIELEGTPYLAQSASPGARRIFVKVLSERRLNASFIDEYGDTVDSWFLSLDWRTVIVPANAPVVLEARFVFFSRETRPMDSDAFPVLNGSLPFLLPQCHAVSCEIPRYTLRRGLRFVETRLVEVASQVDRARETGFVVFEERDSLATGQRSLNKAGMMLERAQDDRDYLRAWTTLREVLGTMDTISRTLEDMRLVSKTSAIYLTAIMAMFSAILAFFLFDRERMKMFSNTAIYIIFLVSLYLSYPGAHIIIDENAPLFLGSATISFFGVSAILFGLPHIWREREIEGEVSWKSAVSIIFSMGKRQIRRRKIRGFFTLLSVVILILAFTSLTSVGTIYGVVDVGKTATTLRDGVMVKRTLYETPLLFLPLGSDDPTAISKIVNITDTALRLKNVPSVNPAARLVNPKTRSSSLIYGILGITPAKESRYTRLEETVQGSYLSETRDDEILVSASVLSSLNANAGENVTLEVSGTGVSSSFTVSGVFDDEKYMSLMDMDSLALGPSRLLPDGAVRRCNSTEVVIMNLKAAEKIQKAVDMRHPEDPPQFVVLSEMLFRLGEAVDVESALRTLTLVFDYDVFVSARGITTHYRIGHYVVSEGAAELLVPLIMVGLNVGTVMLNSVYERRREIRTLLLAGLNPTHIKLIFLAEAVILGMVGGSIGYLAGLGFYRVMAVFREGLMVREKLEWWWSGISFALALLASVLSAIRPAALAVSMYTPSSIRRFKMSEEDAKARQEEIFKFYQARELSMPVKVGLNEKEFFICFLLDQLDVLKTGYSERVENVEEIPESKNARGERVMGIKFDWCLGIGNQERKTRNSLILQKSDREDYYRARLVSEPAHPGLPVNAIDRTVDFAYRAIIYWTKNKRRIMGI